MGLSDPDQLITPEPGSGHDGWSVHRVRDPPTPPVKFASGGGSGWLQLTGTPTSASFYVETAAGTDV
jgi:hypothetical protein